MAHADQVASIINATIERKKLTPGKYSLLRRCPMLSAIQHPRGGTVDTHFLFVIIDARRVNPAASLRHPI